MLVGYMYLDDNVFDVRTFCHFIWDWDIITRLLFCISLTLCKPIHQNYRLFLTTFYPPPLSKNTASWLSQHASWYVPWWMSGSLTRGGGENVPSVPGACATHNFTYLARGPKYNTLVMSHSVISQRETICKMIIRMYMNWQLPHLQFDLMHFNLICSGYSLLKSLKVSTFATMNESIGTFERKLTTLCIIIPMGNVIIAPIPRRCHWEKFINHKRDATPMRCCHKHLQTRLSEINFMEIVGYWNAFTFLLSDYVMRFFASARQNFCFHSNGDALGSVLGFIAFSSGCSLQTRVSSHPLHCTKWFCIKYVW